MSSFPSFGQREEEGFQVSAGCGLTRKQRVYGFIICFCIGTLLSVMVRPRRPAHPFARVHPSAHAVLSGWRAELPVWMTGAALPPRSLPQSMFALLSHNVVAFAVTYTFGNIIGLARCGVRAWCGVCASGRAHTASHRSTGFLVGPWRQLKAMCKKNRAPATAAYFVLIALTLIVATQVRWGEGRGQRGPAALTAWLPSPLPPPAPPRQLSTV